MPGRPAAAYPPVASREPQTGFLRPSKRLRRSRATAKEKIETSSRPVQRDIGTRCAVTSPIQRSEGRVAHRRWAGLKFGASGDQTMKGALLLV
ncbi:uncharacterized protein BP5553_03219 [Venustampulla echinocandica]|uniref:Uncharacterized protein n=1 Tax=Venustampulla echinocandica TaxID=2656787 RepID=A0A370TTM3_9HELO|nr:uncharacterized protein BP5553_03219 [Venustampulla echinocandica]RDL38879.1 hypothetical protein BP5553_03219 [Venustampulla echinocandica]